MNAAGIIVIGAFVAPSEDVRRKVRDTIGTENFVEVYLKAPIDVCRARDTDGMYAKADAGEIDEFPGVSAPYEEPSSPDLVLETDVLGVRECVERIVKLLAERKITA
jgi:bifunctional enzyme CysN/CysC